LTINFLKFIAFTQKPCS